MNKIKGFFYALFLSLLTLVIGLGLINSRINKIPKAILRNYTGDVKFASPERLKEAINEGTMPVFGSSELNSDADKPYYLFYMHKKDQFNLLTIGEGGYQSIVHTGILGSIGNEIQGKKAAFLISPQWFTTKGIESAAIVGKLSLQHIGEFLKNEKITKETKELFIKRVLELTKDIKTFNAQIKSMGDSYFKSGDFKLKDKLSLWQEKTGQKIKFAYNTRNISFENVETTEIDKKFEEKYEEAEKRAKENSSNNDLGIENKYYETYIGPNLETHKNSKQLKISLDSPEFEDFKLFLRVAKELGVEIKPFSIPLHGPWSDYIAVPKDIREAYYKKIVDISRENGLEPVDLSTHEYDKYFLRDVMHMGEKGWVIIDEELTKFKNK